MQIFSTLVGASADGKLYFPRPYLDAKLWKYLRNGNQLLISAPRRVGKTSFLINICNQQVPGYLVKYHITQSINRSNEFFKRLYKSLLEELSTKQNIWESLTEILKRNKVERVGTDGIELNGTELDYYEEFRRLIKKVELDVKLVFVIDEFSETTENIINDQGESEAKLFLHQNRELRQDTDIKSKIQFIYSGSIGLGNIAERLGAIKNVNDLTDFPIPPLSEDESYAMIKQLTVSGEVQFDPEVQKYLLDRIHWYIPYYIQVILDETETILLQKEELVITETTIDKAIDEALKKRSYFEHWHTRLRTAFKGTDYTFAKELLNVASKSANGITATQIFDLAQKYELQDHYNIIQRTLEYDGYITPNEQKVFVFNSPLLRIWWERNIAI